MRVIGAIAIRFGTVRPPSDTGRDRISAAREAAEASTVTWGAPLRIPDSMCIRIGRTVQPSGPAHPIPSAL
ncbi:hypothetical protein GCM10010244_34430 [Streptomyces coeruleorubidus]|nr:hypothetical protein GCM10010244_34430 [Streptomyces bellus]